MLRKGFLERLQVGREGKGRLVAPGIMARLIEEVQGSWERSRLSASKEQQGAKGGYVGVDGGNI